MRSFQSVYATAVLHKGSARAVEAGLPEVRTSQELCGLTDDRYLSELSRRIFRAGLKHSMVDAKWPAFEQAFHGFDPWRVAMLADDELEALAHNPNIIRHFGKIKAVRANASWMLEVSKQHGCFGNFIAAWSGESIVELWLLLKKQGAQLGGQSAPRFLRMVGKDTFLLTDDVVSVLKAEAVVTKMPTSKRDLAAVQATFNRWAEESGRSLAAISRIVSFTANSL